jgi:3-phosphoshikimate 1-carboxyvinyltransferase
LAKARFLRGEVLVPGDKSITHRALIFSALTRGKARISGALGALDCLSTASCLRRLGLSIDAAQPATGATKNGSTKSGATFEHTPINPCGRLDLVVKSRGIETLNFGEATKDGPLVLDAGNSGTTMRILSGLLAGLPGNFLLSGDQSLNKRDMRRVLEPLGQMGAGVKYVETPGKAPFVIGGGDLKGGRFDLTVASAQVEAALLLAGLLADGKTVVTMPSQVRDHTLNAFRHLGVPFHNEGLTTTVEPLSGELEARDFTVPGDLSSAAFFLVAAAIMPGSSIVIPAVGTNAGRGLVVDVLRRMGADIAFTNERLVNFEPVCDIELKAPDRLMATDIGAAEVPLGIDELPVLALAFALASGSSRVSGAAELKEKESNRLSAICTNLANQGVCLEELPDGFIIEGAERLRGGGQWPTHHDHRLAMTGLVAQLVAVAPLQMGDTACIDISYPGFAADLEQLVERAG